MQGCMGGFDGYAKRAVAMAVRWRHMNKRHINVECIGPEQRRYLAQEYWGVIGPTLLHGLARIGSDEQAIHAKDTLEAGMGVVGGTFGMELNDFNIAQLAGAINQCVK
jgi:hypothetical protein